MTGLQLRIDAFVKLHGNYRAAAAALNMLQEVTDRLAWLNSDDDEHIMELTDRARAILTAQGGKP